MHYPSKPTIYLAGPINGRSDFDCNDWRTEAKQLLGERFATLDPMARDYRGREMEPGIDKVIVEGDKSDIDKSHCLLVYFDKPSVGTAMEVLYAHDKAIPVVVINVSGKAPSPWLKYHARSIADTLHEGVAVAIVSACVKFGYQQGWREGCDARDSR